MLNGAEGQNRTADTGIFSPSLYQLSYLGAFKQRKDLYAFTKALAREILSFSLFFCHRLREGIQDDAQDDIQDDNPCAQAPYSPTLKLTLILKSFVAGRLRMGTPVWLVMLSRRSWMYSLEGPITVNQTL